jgi:hypothetical protein
MIITSELFAYIWVWKHIVVVHTLLISFHVTDLVCVVLVWTLRSHHQLLERAGERRLMHHLPQLPILLINLRKMWTLPKVFKSEAQQRERVKSLTLSQGQTVEDSVCGLLELILRCVPWWVERHDGYHEFLSKTAFLNSAYAVFSYNTCSFLYSWSVCASTHSSVCQWIIHNMQCVADFQCCLCNMSGDVRFEILIAVFWRTCLFTPMRV